MGRENPGLNRARRKSAESCASNRFEIMSEHNTTSRKATHCDVEALKASA